MSETDTQMGGKELVNNIIENEEDVYVLNPSENFMNTLVHEVKDEWDDTVTFNVIATQDVLKSIRSEFITASKMAELIETGRMEIRSSEFENGGFIVSDSNITAIGQVGDELVSISTSEVPESVVESAQNKFTGSEEFQLRTPSLSHVYDSLSEDLGEDVSEEFQAVMEEIGQFSDEFEMDEVAAAILVAANHNELLYDISKWGEDCGLASKATFSRTKTQLEDQGLITTDKVPIDVGRPRLRLKLVEDEVEGNVENIVNTIQSAPLPTP